MVLPAHGDEFHGFRERIDELLAHHEERLAEVCEVLGEAARSDGVRGGLADALEPAGALERVAAVHAPHGRSPRRSLTWSCCATAAAVRRRIADGGLVRYAVPSR